MSREQIIQAVHAFLGSYPAQSEGDIQKRADLFAQDVVFEDPVGAPPLVGKGALTEFFRNAVASGWVIHMSSDRVVVCGNEAVSLTKASWGLAGSEPAKVSVVHTFAFDDVGRIKTPARVL